MKFGQKIIGVLAYYWRPAFPLLTVLVIGWVMRSEVKASIDAMPHPQLLIAIGVLALFGIVVVFRVQHHSYRELKFINLKMGRSSGKELALHSARSESRHIFSSVDRLIVNSSKEGDGHMLQSALSHELTAAENQLTDTLDLPGYIAGALVGMGLLGTFIGLIDTLGSMVSLIGSLKSVGGPDTDMFAIFANLIGELQRPMRAMATAFMASLYGLLGSMTLGFMLAFVRKSIAHTVAEAHRVSAQQVQILMVRFNEAEKHVAEEVIGTDHERWAALFKELRQEHREGLSEVHAIKQQTIEAFGQVDSLINVLKERNSTDQLIKNVLGNGVHWHDALEQLRDQTARLELQNIQTGRLVSESVRVVGEMVAGLGATQSTRDAALSGLLVELREASVRSADAGEGNSRALLRGVESMSHYLAQNQLHMSAALEKINTLLKFQIGESTVNG